MKRVLVNTSLVIQYCFLHCTHVVAVCSSAKAVVGGPPMVTNEVVQDLKQNMYKLEEEVSKLLLYFWWEVVSICHNWVFLTAPEKKL